MITNCLPALLYACKQIGCCCVVLTNWSLNGTSGVMGQISGCFGIWPCCGGTETKGKVELNRNGYSVWIQSCFLVRKYSYSVWKWHITTLFSVFNVIDFSHLKTLLK